MFQTCRTVDRENITIVKIHSHFTIKIEEKKNMFSKYITLYVNDIMVNFSVFLAFKDQIILISLDNRS